MTPRELRDKSDTIDIKANGTKRAAPNSIAAREAKPAIKLSPKIPSKSAKSMRNDPTIACNRAVFAPATNHARGIAGANMDKLDICQSLPETATAAPK